MEKKKELYFAGYDIVFQEIPDEITLAINLSDCPHQCAGCHSRQLQKKLGIVLTQTLLTELYNRYAQAISTLCFMGGDAAPERVVALALFLRELSNGKLKTAWYSGNATLPNREEMQAFNYLKIGPYIEHLGALPSPTTNQRMYRIEGEHIEDITYRFQSRNSASLP